MAPNPYTLVDSGKNSSLFHMEHDERLLEGVSHATLRFYEFTRGHITYGYFIDPSKWLKGGLPKAARRPTGGGLIFHGTDFSFTFALPLKNPLTSLPPLERYHLINTQVLKAVKSLLPKSCCSLLKVGVQDVVDELCMANPTIYDIMHEGKKVGGSSQRKNKHAFIHQCSLFLYEPEWATISEDLLDPERVLPFLKAHTGSLLQEEVVGFREKLKEALAEQLAELV